MISPEQSKFTEDPLYIKLREVSKLASSMQRNSEFSTTNFNAQLAKEAQILSISGEAFSRQFADGIAHNDFAQSEERTLLIETIDEIKGIEPGDRKTLLQAFLTVTLPAVIDPPYLPEQMRTNWKALTSKLLQENSQQITEGYSRSPLSEFIPSNFQSTILRLMGELMVREKSFDEYKQVAWLLTS